jgi:hypothetical protein
MTINDSTASDAAGHALAEEGRRVRGFIASNRSETLLRLFDFLLQQSLEGRRPKETEIAEEVFQEGSSEPGHQGSRVRVGVYRLRKKLDLFYADRPGTRLVIPQGEYGFLLETSEITEEQGGKFTAGKVVSFRLGSASWIALAIILLNILLLVLYLNKVNLRNYIIPTGFLNAFENKNGPAVVVMGDYFMFMEKIKNDDIGKIVQDLSLDSADTFYEYVTKNPELRDGLVNEDLYAVSSDILGSLSHLSSYIGTGQMQPITTSDLNPDIMKSSKIIYLGALDAISPLLSTPLFQASKFRCAETCYEIIDTPSGRRFLSDSPYLLGDRIVPRRDYGYIASYPGPSGNQILILSGTGDAGAAQMVNVVTDKKMMEQLRRRIGRNFRSFEALYQVRTMFNRSYGSEILIARPINSERIWDKARRDK